MTDVQQARTAAQQHYTVTVKPALKVLQDAKSKADWAGRNLVITKAANTKAKQIAVELGRQVTQLKSFNLHDFDTRLQDLQRNYTFAFNNFAASINRVLDEADTFVHDVRQTPRAAVFNHEIQERARNITQLLGNVERLHKNGFDLGKPVPAQELHNLERWAEGHDALADKAKRQAVLDAIGRFEDYVDDVKNWWR
jgi:hypothetical protein